MVLYYKFRLSYNEISFPVSLRVFTVIVCLSVFYYISRQDLFLIHNIETRLSRGVS